MSKLNYIKIIIHLLIVLSVVNSHSVSAQVQSQIPKRIQKQFLKARQSYVSLDWKAAEEQLWDILDKNPALLSAAVNRREELWDNIMWATDTSTGYFSPGSNTTGPQNGSAVSWLNGSA